MSWLSGRVLLTSDLSMFAKIPTFMEMENFYEDMFNVIECISVPEINYKITPENIKIYLKELDKYFNGNDEQY